MSYEFLIEMGWKSAAIAGAALLLVWLLRSRSAADRGSVLKVGVALLLALPAIALFAPTLEIEALAPAPAIEAAPPAPLQAAALAAPLPTAAVGAVETGGHDWNDPSILFFLLYLGGVAMVGGRLLAGLWTLRRWTRDAREVESPGWLAALARAGGDALGIRLMVSEDASSPLSWGWRRPVVLIDRDTLRQPEEAEVILAHEVAHVARRDWPSLLLSRIAVALFWFNPLVWRLDREVAQQAEEAADSDATVWVEPARYAQTLLDWARHGSGPLPANAIAAGEPGLSKRVRAILEGRMTRSSGSSWAIVAMLGCAAFAAPVAAIEFVAPEPPEAPFAPPAPPAEDALEPLAPLAPMPPGTATAPGAPPAPPAFPGSARAPDSPGAPPAPPALALALANWAHAAANAAASVAAHAAGRSAPRSHVDEKAIEAQVEAAVAQAMKAVEAATAEAERVTEQAVEAALASVAHGAIGMEAGAKGMDQGAADMRAEARRLRNRDYREAQIRTAAARGDRLTHEELIEAANGLEEGAEGMREGAQEMRQAAREMREEARRKQQH